MLGERDDLAKEDRPPAMGRVIDLRKSERKGHSNDNGEVAAAHSIPLHRRLGFFRWKRNKGINFLRPYLVKEKEEEFIEQELMREYFDETEEEVRRDSLSTFFHSVMVKARAWRLPIFMICLSWRVFKRIKRGAEMDEASKQVVASEAKPSATVIDRGAKERKKEDVLVLKLPKKAKSSTFGDFIGVILSWPKSVLEFVSGRTTEDYLYQRVLINEMARPRFNPLRHLLSFTAIVLVVMLPIKALSYYKVVDFEDLKGKVLGVSEEAVSDMGSAADRISTFDLSGAAEELSSAKDNFGQARAELDKVNSLLLEMGKLAPSKKIRLASYGKDFLSAGEVGASLGQNMLLAANAFADRQDKGLPEMIDDFLRYEEAALADAKELSSIMDRIDRSVLPADRSAQFDELDGSVKDMIMMLSSVSDVAKKAKVFIGAESDKRYLLVFQNNSEMRASGGFVGSFALIDISRGKIKNIEVPGGGSYDTEGGLKKLMVAPEPLWLVNPLWHFWDANWWPDWKKSAEKLEWFYAKSGGPSVDGVIAFTPTVLERLLKVIGPIDMTDDYGVTMDSDNLWINLRDTIEKEKLADQNLPNEVAEKKPKRVIGDLLSKMSEEIPKRLNKDMVSGLISSLNESLNDKQILFHFNDADLQAEAEKRNWAGRIKETSKDYLYVVNTNIAGGKSDGKMEERISHKAEISEDGSVIDTVTIVKKHNGVEGEPYFGVRNVNWLRVYVPLGSRLLEADGFRGPDPIYFDEPDEVWEDDVDVDAENGDNASIDTKNLNTKVYQESGKTVFANWVMVDPGHEVVITLKYKLPFKMEKKVVQQESKSAWDDLMDRFMKVEKKDLYVYSLMIQKQPGMRFSSFDSSLRVSSDFSTTWRYPVELDANGGWDVSGTLEEDKYWAVVLEKTADGITSEYGQ